MKTNLCLVLAVLAVPGAAAAQTITGGLTLGYGSTDAGDVAPDLTSRGLDGRMNVDFGNGFDFGFQAGKISVDVDDTPLSLEGEFIGFDGGYRFSNGLKAGGYVERLTLGVDGFPIDITLKSHGLSAGYEHAGLDVEVFAGQSSLSLGILPADIENRGLTVGYTAVPKLNVGGAYLETTIASGGTEVDLDFTGLAGTYSVTEQLIAFGGISRSSVDLLGLDVDTMGFGVGYDLAGMVGVSSTVSLELARTELSVGPGSEDLDTVRLGVTFPLGATGPALPMNSVADSILNPRHGTLNTALTAAF